MAHGAAELGARVRKSLLFSEEKRSKKDFIRLHARQGMKVFWFFFSKKNRFLMLRTQS
jgi:hypothetical protein